MITTAEMDRGERMKMNVLPELTETEYTILDILRTSPYSLSTQEIYKRLGTFSWDKIQRILKVLETRGYIEKREVSKEERKKEKYLWFIPIKIRDKMKS